MIWRWLRWPLLAPSSSCGAASTACCTAQLVSEARGSRARAIRRDGETLKKIGAAARTAERREKLQQVLPLVASYSAAFGSTTKLIAQNSRLLEVEGKLAGDMIKSRADLKKSQDASLAATKAAGEKNIHSTILTSVAIAAIAVVIGILLHGSSRAASHGRSCRSTASWPHSRAANSTANQRRRSQG